MSFITAVQQLLAAVAIVGTIVFVFRRRARKRLLQSQRAWSEWYGETERNKREAQRNPLVAPPPKRLPDPDLRRIDEELSVPESRKPFHPRDLPDPKPERRSPKV